MVKSWCCSVAFRGLSLHCIHEVTRLTCPHCRKHTEWTDVRLRTRKRHLEGLQSVILLVQLQLPQDFTFLHYRGLGWIEKEFLRFTSGLSRVRNFTFGFCDKAPQSTHCTWDWYEGITQLRIRGFLQILFAVYDETDTVLRMSSFWLRIRPVMIRFRFKSLWCVLGQVGLGQHSWVTDSGQIQNFRPDSGSNLNIECKKVKWLYLFCLTPANSS